MNVSLGLKEEKNFVYLFTNYISFQADNLLRFCRMNVIET